MTKKAQPDPKTRTIQHLDGDKASAKEHAYIKSKHYVDTSMSKNTFGSMTISFDSPNQDNEYKLTNHQDDSE